MSTLLQDNFWFSNKAKPDPVIVNCLRFRGAQNLVRTPSVEGNRTTWTFSYWIKVGDVDAIQPILEVRVDSQNQSFFRFSSSNESKLRWFNRVNNSGKGDVYTVALYRDPSAWYNVTGVANFSASPPTFTTYVNGVLQSMTSPTNIASGESYINSTQPHQIGSGDTGPEYMTGYLSEISFIDGQALTAADFGEYNTDGIWIPKNYAGTYGTNGFHLAFGDPSNIGEDTSGNGNDFTASGFELTDTTDPNYDWLEDTPDNNYGTFNPIDIGTDSTYLSANMQVPGGAATTNREARTTTARVPLATSGGGKYYMEMTYYINYGQDGNMQANVGAMCDIVTNNTSQWARNYDPDSGWKVSITGGSTTEGAYGSTFSVGDVMNIAVDMNVGKIFFGKNGVWQASADPVTGANPAFSDLLTAPDDYLSIGCNARGRGFYINNGQREFDYTPPAGYQDISTATLPSVAISKPSNHFDVITDTGANVLTAAQAKFSTGLWWVKELAGQNNHQLMDSLRGGLATIETSNINAISNTYTAPSGTSAAFSWYNGGTQTTNTDGTLTTTVVADNSSGFSMIKFDINGVPSTLGHGLSKAPTFIFGKVYTRDTSFPVYHEYMGGNSYMYMDRTEVKTTTSSIWNNTDPTSTVISVGGGTPNNINPSSGGSGSSILYAWYDIPGYSSFGSYVGNGNSDGPFVYTGFKPAFVIRKSVNVTGRWYMNNYLTPSYNPITQSLSASEQNGNYTNGDIDFLSNGFKMRTSSDSSNDNNEVYIYAAWAEHPFGGANTVPTTAR